MGVTICYMVTYFVEALLIYLYYDFLFDKKRNVLWIILSFGLMYTALFFTFSVQNMVLNAVLYTVGNLLLLIIHYRCSFKQAILHALFLSCALLLSEYFTATWIGAIWGDLLSYDTDLSASITMAFVSKLLYLLLTSVGSRIFARQKLLNETLRITILFCSMPLLSLVLTLVSIQIASVHAISQGNVQIIAIGTTTLMAVNLLFLILYNYIKKENAEKLLLQVSVEKERTESAYYQALHEEKESRNILLHDIKNHLGAIATLADQGKTEDVCKYIAELKSTLVSKDPLELCQDPILGLILYHTSQECKEAGICFYQDIQDCCEDYLDDSDKTALLSNLLSNAVEAAKDSADKEIDFSIRHSGNANGIVITTENSCDTKPITDSRGRFRTVKSSPGIHGLGMQSIARIVKKHGGHSTVSYDEESRRFHHVIYLPKTLEKP